MSSDAPPPDHETAVPNPTRPAEAVAGMQVAFDLSVHDRSDVLRALYRWTDRVAAEIREADGTLVCDLTFLQGGLTERGVNTGLQRDVLDEGLRSQIRAETEGVRNLIFAYAFSGLVGELPDAASASES